MSFPSIEGATRDTHARCRALNGAAGFRVLGSTPIPWATLVACLAFCVYLRTLAPGLLPGDRAEFQFAAWGWTLTHPTGYPFYLLLGGIWQHSLPWGDPAFRLNLFSAVWASITVGLAYLVFRRVARSHAAALIAALAFAFSYTFWLQATQAETYSLNAFSVALLTWLAFKWAESQRPRAQGVGGGPKYSAAWALTFGLALTNHRTIILLLPAFAAYFASVIYVRSRSPDPPRVVNWRRFLSKRTIIYALLFTLPLLLYLYVPLRGPATPYAQLQVSPGQTIVVLDNTPSGWLSYIQGRTFQSLLAFNDSSWQSLLFLPQRILREFNPIGVGVGLFGLAALVYRLRWSLVGLTVLGSAAIVLFAVSYHIGSIGDYYIPAYFFFASWIAVGLGVLEQLLMGSVHTHARWLLFVSSLFLILIFPVYNLVSTFTEHDRSMETEWRARWESILASNPPLGAILISNDRDEIMPLLYLQLVEGKRPDLLGLYPFNTDASTLAPTYADTVGVIESVLDSGRPIFLIKALPDLDLRFRLEPAPAGMEAVFNLPPEPVLNIKAIIGDKLQVVGYRILSGATRAGSTFSLAVDWQPLARLTRDYNISLQLLDGSGHKIAQGNDHRPGGDIYPSSLWRTGETLEDHFVMTIPPEARAGKYNLYVRVYNLTTGDSLGELTAIGTIAVAE
jgi:hypothetical protein